MSTQRSVRLIIRELVDMPEYKDLSYTDILNIVYWSQFGCVHNTISNCDILDKESFNSIALAHLGSFVAHPKKVEQRVEYSINKERLKNEKSS